MSKAREQVIALLSRRDHSRLELSDKLRAKGASEADIADALAYAASYGALNDDKVATHVKSKLVTQRYGNDKIEAELEKRGLDSSVADDELPRARELWLTLQHKYEGRARAAAGFLARRGFSEDTIRTLLGSQLEE